MHTAIMCIAAVLNKHSTRKVIATGSQAIAYADNSNCIAAAATSVLAEMHNAHDTSAAAEAAFTPAIVPYQLMLWSQQQ